MTQSPTRRRGRPGPASRKGKSTTTTTVGADLDPQPRVSTKEVTETEVRDSNGNNVRSVPSPPPRTRSNEISQNPTTRPSRPGPASKKRRTSTATAVDDDRLQIAQIGDEETNRPGPSSKKARKISVVGNEMNGPRSSEVVSRSPTRPGPSSRKARKMSVVASNEMNGPRSSEVASRSPTRPGPSSKKARKMSVVASNEMNGPRSSEVVSRSPTRPGPALGKKQSSGGGMANRSANISNHEEEVSYQQDQDEDEVDPDLALKVIMLVSGTSQICKVTSLLTIEVNRKAFKTYRKTMEALLFQNHHAISSNERKHFSVKFDKITANGEFILFRVFDQQDDDEDTKTEVLMALLIGSPSGPSSNRLPGVSEAVPAIKYSTFIYNGPTKMWNVLKAGFEKSFSSTFAPCSLLSTFIKELTGIYICEGIKNHQIGQKHSDLLIKHCVGSPAGANYTLQSRVGLQYLYKRWERLLADTKIDKESKIKIIWKDITNEVTEKNHINLAKMKFLAINSNTFVISHTGRFKIRLKEIGSTLKFLRRVGSIVEDVTF